MFLLMSLEGHEKIYRKIPLLFHIPESKVHGDNMGPTWVPPAPDGPHVGPMNLVIRDDGMIKALEYISAPRISLYKAKDEIWLG